MLRLRHLIPAFICLLCCAAESGAQVQGREFDYGDKDAKLAGYLAVPAHPTALSPAVVIFSDWMGIGEFAKQRARRLAEAGYIALAADVYGGGQHAKDAEEAGSLAAKFKSDRPLLRERAKAAFTALIKVPGVDSQKIAAIGFCFGGTAALELARAGAPLAGVVSFHGGLETPNPEMAKNIKAKILALHGADDPFVKADEVAGFEKEMRDANVDWQLVKYGNAVHAFTNPDAGSDNSKGAAYNAEADHRSYKAMEDFFQEIFGKRG